MDIDWTDTDAVANAVGVLAAIEAAWKEGKHVPQPVAEGVFRLMPKTSTELVIFNAEGDIYLSRRPSRGESQSEPYPDMLHVPGVTHFHRETRGLAEKRLRAREIGSDARIDRMRLVGETEDVDEQRGVYNLRIHIAQLRDGTLRGEPKGEFWPHGRIPREQLVPSHRNTILPIAIRAARSQGWIRYGW